MAVDLFAVADESGIHGDAPYCVVSGWIASPKEWLAFEPDWAEILKSEDVESFHSKEFFARDQGGQRVGPYRGWTDSRALRFIDRLLAAINRRRMYPIGGAVDVGAFNALTHGERRWLTGGLYASLADDLSEGRWLNSGAPSKPYYLAFQTLLIQAAQRTPPDVRVHFIFDRQNVLQAKAQENFNDIVKRGPLVVDGDPKNLGMLMFGSSAEEPSLQAADLHTHAWYSYLVRGEKLSLERQYALDRITRRRRGMGVCNAWYLERIIGRLPSEVLAQLRGGKSA